MRSGIRSSDEIAFIESALDDSGAYFDGWGEAPAWSLP